MTTQGDSIITHPALAEIFLPHPFLICLPYGALTKNRYTKVIAATTIHKIRKLLKILTICLGYI
jgi:uncharacterized membrane protein YwzB